MFARWGTQSARPPTSTFTGREHDAWSSEGERYRRNAARRGDPSTPGGGGAGGGGTRAGVAEARGGAGERAPEHARDEPGSGPPPGGRDLPVGRGLRAAGGGARGDRAPARLRGAPFGRLPGAPPGAVRG